MRRIFLMAMLILAAAPAARAEEFNYAAWDRVLKKFVNENGRVDYAALKADSKDLDECTAAIAARSPASHPGDFPTREHQLAYWINAYNALVMKGVVENWPVKSVRDIGALYGFFWRKKFIAGGKKYTLNTIEGEFLRRQLAEPRIHFAIVCAAVSCPRLQREAYTAATVERLLDEAARTYFSEPRNLKIDAARNRVKVPRILDYYKEDFVKYVRAKKTGGAAPPLVEYVKLYTTAENRRALEALKSPSVDHFDYDWTINDVHTPVNAAALSAKGPTP